MYDTEASSLTSFLKTLPSQELVGLYKNQWTCQAVFRSLPSVARQYVLRLLFVDQPLHQCEHLLNTHILAGSLWDCAMCMIYMEISAGLCFGKDGLGVVFVGLVRYARLGHDRSK